jgi:hypothetical protein
MRCGGSQRGALGHQEGLQRNVEGALALIGHPKDGAARIAGGTLRLRDGTAPMPRR